MKVDIEKYFMEINNPAQYLGNEFNSIHKEDYKMHICLIYPDLYEVGMSSQAIGILYNITNKVDGAYMERAFAPDVDMEEILRENNIPMFSWESKTALKDFDFVAFSLSYEMTYTNVLNIINMAQVAIERKDRTENDPIIVAGGTGAYNPKMLEEFIDIFFIGEGEELLEEFAEIMVKNSDKTRDEKMKIASELEGVYVPKYYNGQRIKKRIVKDLNKVEFPKKGIVPFVEIVHDRAVVEIQRGCTRGCRFCQAGMIYRPVRERTLKNNFDIIKSCIDDSGFNEVSLSSLSSSDYSEIEGLIEKIQEEYEGDNVGIVLPSLRIDNFSIEIAKKLSSLRKTGFTFAPEAGSQRMRDIINKGVNEEDIMTTALEAFKAGWRHLKFYFMIGLPFETMEDVEAIYDISKKVIDAGRKIRKDIDIAISVSNFVPKSNTPFQWSKQMGMQEMEEKHKYLINLFNKEKRLNLRLNNRNISYLEGFLSRGDEKVGKVIKRAWELGAKFDGWRIHFNKEAWYQAMDEIGAGEEEYLGARDLDAKLPWEIIDTGISKQYLLDELKKAEEISLTPDCRENCTGCMLCDVMDVAVDIAKK